MKRSIFIICLLFLMILTGCGRLDELKDAKMDILNDNIKTDRLLDLMKSDTQKMDDFSYMLMAKKSVKDFSINEIKGYLSNSKSENIVNLIREILVNQDISEINIEFREYYTFLNDEDENILQLFVFSTESDMNLYLYFTWDNSEIVDFSYNMA